MKRILSIVIFLVMGLVSIGCGQQTKFDIGITIPAHTNSDFTYQEEFMFSEEEISPKSDTITILSGKGLNDTMVVLMPVDVKEENAYEPTYLTPGMPVEMDVEKGAWLCVPLQPSRCDTRSYAAAH